MAKSHHALLFALLLGFAAISLGKHASSEEDPEEEAAEAATIKAADRKGVDKLWLGHYELTKCDEQYPKILEAIGYSKDAIKSIVEMKHVKVCITKKEEMYTMWTRGRGKRVKTSFEPGKEFSDVTAEGKPYKGIVKVINESTLCREETHGSEKLNMDVKLDADGFTVVYKIKGISSTQRFTRAKDRH